MAEVQGPLDSALWVRSMLEGRKEDLQPISAWLKCHELREGPTHPGTRSREGE
jgi:hypothetical protein